MLNRSDYDFDVISGPSTPPPAPVAAFQPRRPAAPPPALPCPAPPVSKAPGHGEEA